MLTSLKNPLVKEMRKLHRGKGRCEQGLLLLEGTNLIEAVCRKSQVFVTFCYTSSWQERYPQLWELGDSLAQRSEMVSEEVLSAIATTVNPDGVVATISREGRNQILPEKLQLGLVCDRIQDPGNLGTIIRTAVATNVDVIWLSNDSVDPENPKVLRASAGAWFQLPIIVSDNLPQLVSQYQQQGVQIIATLPEADKSYWDLDLTIPSLILLGNEGAGLSPELEDLAQQKVKIPLSNGVESLNVAIATALILYESQRQLKYEIIASFESLKPRIYE